MDPNGRRCGVLYGDVPDLSGSDQFVLMSWCPARIRDPHWSYMVLTSLEAGSGFDESVFPVENGCFNTMLIRWNGQFAERLAVAQIHVNAFSDAGVSAKRVRLI